MNKIQECENYFTQIFDFIEREKSVESKILLFKEVIYIFFRVENLNSFYQENISNNEIFLKNSPIKNQGNENIHNEINLNTEVNNNLEKINWKKEKEMNDFDQDEFQKKNLSKTLLCLHKFLRENDIESWIRCLVEESAYFKSVKEVNGYVFTIINQYAANYYQTGKTGDFKNIYSTIINNYGERAKEKNKDRSPEKILIEMKSRIELAVDIYKKLIKKEGEIYDLYAKELKGINADNKGNENNNNDNKENLNSYKGNNFNNFNNNEIDEYNSNKFLIKIFFKHALYQINKQQANKNNNNNTKIDLNTINSPNNDSNLNDLNNNNESNLRNNNDNTVENSLANIKSQIELALKLLENDEFDISSINIFQINSEVTKSVRILFENIKMIRNKKELEKAFRNWKIKGLGYLKMSDKMQNKYTKSVEYFRKLQEEITKG